MKQYTDDMSVKRLQSTNKGQLKRSIAFKHYKYVTKVHYTNPSQNIIHLIALISSILSLLKLLFSPFVFLKNTTLGFGLYFVSPIWLPSSHSLSGWLFACTHLVAELLAKQSHHEERDSVGCCELIDVLGRGIGEVWCGWRRPSWLGCSALANTQYTEWHVCAVA